MPNDFLGWLIPLAPLVAAIVCAIMSLTGRGRHTAHIPAWIGLSIAAVASIAMCLSVDLKENGLILGGYSWLDVGPFRIDISLLFDAVSLVQICVVTCVSALVAFYAAGYMHDDPGYARFFAVFSAFVFSMAMLVLASNLLVLYFFWEGVGVCSYLLIGYWYQRPAAAKAAFKAFLVNRIADCGFLVGILLLFYAVGDVIEAEAGLSRLDYRTIFGAVETIHAEHPQLLGWIAGLLLLGAVGKSAQFPLHVWLPDAMEGPTPVSALIHAATMVTAGVYLLCRMAQLFVFTPDVLVLAGWLGGITAILAALMALCQHDLKRVLAYSTVSQLGYMFMAIACGASKNLMSAAVMAALFHVATHACFKALLFLSAGNVMHAMGDVIDMREFGGLRRVLPRTHLLFGIGAAALAGVPLLAGFWSKDGILVLLDQMRHDPKHGSSFTALLAIALTTALLTALYSFRAYWRTFHGKEHFPKEAGGHPHEMPVGMIWPLAILAGGSVLVGLALGPTGVLQKYLSQIPLLEPIEMESHGWTIPLLSVVACALGIGLGWMSVRRMGQTPAKHSPLAPLFKLGENRFYLDEIYLYLVVKPVSAIGKRLAIMDIQMLDGFWRGLCRIPGVLGVAVRRYQSGLVSNYASWMTFGVIALLIIVLLR